MDEARAQNLPFTRMHKLHVGCIIPSGVRFPPEVYWFVGVDFAMFLKVCSFMTQTFSSSPTAFKHGFLPNTLLELLVFATSEMITP